MYSSNTYNYFKGDYDALNDYLFTIVWDLLFTGNDISLNWNTFKDMIFEGCQKFIPMSSVVHKKSTPPWWTKSLARTIQKKRSLYFKYRATRSKTDYQNYAFQRNLVKTRVRSAQMAYEEQLHDKEVQSQSQSTLCLHQGQVESQGYH